MAEVIKTRALVSSNSGSSPRLLAGAVLILLYFLTGKLGLRLATINPSATAVWAPAGISLAYCLLYGRSIWPAVFIGAFLVNVTSAGSVATSLGIASGNTLEAVAGAYLVQRFANGLAAFERTADAFRFLITAAIFSTMLSPTIGLASLCIGAYARWSEYPQIWLTWWLGDAAGDLIVAPLVIMWTLMPRVSWSRKQWTEMVLLLGAVALVAVTMFDGWPGLRLPSYPVEFLSLAVMLWAAFRFGSREAATVLFLILLGAIVGTANGVGPYSASNQNDALLMLQTFAGLMSMMIIAVATEVAQRRRLDEQHARIAAIVESSNDAVVGLSPDGKIISWNPSAAKIFGFAAAEATGQPITLIVPEARLEEERQILKRVARGELVSTFETARRRKDGTLVEVSITVSPVRANDGRIIGASKISRDITEQNRLRREREELLRAERTARAAAETAGRAKDEFLAMLGHELRNPLHATALSLEVLKRAKTVEEGARAREIITRQTEHLSRMVDDLLDVARVTTGRIVLLHEPIDLAVTVSECIDAACETGQLAKHRLETELASAWVMGDANRLSQVVTNLITNATRYTPSGGRIRVTVSAKGAQALVQIEDDGLGIAPEILPRIFNLFERGNIGTDRFPSGLGIGLTLVKRLIELHDGKVEVLSEGPGRGSTFLVKLPLIDVPKERSSNRGRAIGANTSSRRILIVEDSPLSREGFRSWLEALGYEVCEAEDGPSAVAKAMAARPDFALIDIGLPGFDGYEVATRIRAGAIGPPPILIAVSGYGGRDYRAKAATVGFTEYFLKPVDLDKLATLMANLSVREKRRG